MLQWIESTIHTKTHSCAGGHQSISSSTSSAQRDEFCPSSSTFLRMVWISRSFFCEQLLSLVIQDEDLSASVSSSGGDRSNFGVGASSDPTRRQIGFTRASGSRGRAH